MSIHLFTGAAAAGSAGIPIRPPSWWEAKYSLASDLSFFGKDISADSEKHYQLGLGVCGNARMGEATGKAVYYDRAYYYLTGIIDLATVMHDGYLGWYDLTRKPPNGPAPELSLMEIYCWRFAPDILLPTKGNPDFASRWTRVHEFLERNIWTKWRTRSLTAGNVGEEIYRSVLHIASHWAKLALYLRVEGSTSTIRAQADAICAAISHDGMPNWGGANIYDQVRKLPHPLGGPDTAYWNAYWRTPPTEPYGSDTPHGIAIGTFVSEAMRLGYGPWNITVDVPRFIKLRDIIYNNPKGTCWATLNPGGTFNGSKTWAGKTAEFGCFAQFDRNFQRYLEDDEARGVSNGSEKWGSWALNAARLGGPYL